MFDKEFYPTPKHVLDSMGIDCAGKICLEPSAGKGDIIDYLYNNNAKKVLACEKNADLRKIIEHKAQVIEHDFFDVKAEQVSHVDLIVMNPPFSVADKHVMHAWSIAPEGCEIIALCNWQTLDKHYSRSRKSLDGIVKTYGTKEYLGDCFSNAERKTDVEVGLIHLFKPVLSADANWDGFFVEADEELNGEGIMPYNEIRAVVNSYVAAVSCFDEVKEQADRLNQITQLVGYSGGFVCTIGRDDRIETKEAFAKSLQKQSWEYIFRRMKIDKYVTTGVKKDINKFVEQQTQYPFTMRNIYRMMEIIVGTRDHVMNRAIVEAVDNFTRHTHQNRFGLEGWKTNEGHLLNKKFIANNIAEIGYGGGLRIRSWYNNVEQIKDLVKALCYLTGTNYSELDDFERLINETGLESNTWYEWSFFEFKVFKKGTGHFKFKDLKVWEQLNRRYAEIKGQVLPEKI